MKLFSGSERIGNQPVNLSRIMHRDGNQDEIGGKRGNFRVDDVKAAIEKVRLGGKIQYLVALVLLAAMKELPATLLLHPTGMGTLAMSVWSDTTVGRYAPAAPAALPLILLSTIPTWILTRASRRIG